MFAKKREKWIRDKDISNTIEPSSPGPGAAFEGMEESWETAFLSAQLLQSTLYLFLFPYRS